MRRSASCCAAALAAAVWLVACGGSAKTPSLSRAQYIARADAICRGLEQTARRLSGGSQPFRRKVIEVLHARETANEQLRKLHTDSEKEFAAPEWLHFREAATKATHGQLDTKRGSKANNLAGIDEYRARERAAAIAKAAGMPHCARVV
jgi:hypothetical protein